jgi:FMN phosphatase YigB (HAD superfamily)
MSVDLVVFDLGRVLLRICDSWEHACEVAGFAPPATAPELDEDGRTRLKEIIERFDSGKSDVQHFAREIAPFRGFSVEQVVALINAYLLGPYDDTAELLRELHSRGVLTACLSNTTAVHWDRVLDPADSNYIPMHLLDHHFASHLVGMCKPSDAIYEHVERETGVAGERIVFFDDLQENIDGALRRGWKAHRIETTRDPIAQIREHLQTAGIVIPMSSCAHPRHL